MPLLLCNPIIFHFFCEIPCVKKLAFRVQILFFSLIRFFLVLIVAKIFLSLGYLFMDELQRAVAQFYPSTSGGGFNQPTGPSDNSSIFVTYSAAELGSQQEGGADPSSHPQDPSSSQPGPSQIQDDKAKDEEPNRAMENAFKKQDEIAYKIENIIKGQELYLEDPLDIKRGVDIFLTDIMALHPDTRTKQLRTI